VGAVRRFEQLLGLVGVVALAITYSLITGWNPVKDLRVPSIDLRGWLEDPGSLADPEAAWVKRIGGQPDTAGVTDRAVVVTSRGVVEAYDVRSGDKLWGREADWGGLAGEDAGTVVVAGKVNGDGFDVLDPVSGAVRWSDGGAVGAWTYREAVLALTCSMLSDCTLANRAPADGATRWKLTLPGIGRGLRGLNHELLGTRELSRHDDALGAVPRSLPPLLGYPLDRRVQVLDTAAGRLVRAVEPGRSQRTVVTGGVLLTTSGTARGGGCRHLAEAADPAGRVRWRREGYDLGTASGAGCEQRRDPGGAEGVLAAVRGDNREVLLAAADGREIHVAAPGETVLATDGRYAVLRAADRHGLRAVDLRTGRVAWTAEAGERAEVAVSRYAVVATDVAGRRLRAYDPVTGRVMVDVESDVSVLGIGPTGLVLHRGRVIGHLPYGTAGTR
jgi:hypothetical protein